MEKDFTLDLIQRCRDRSASMDEAVQKAIRTLTGTYLLSKKKAQAEIERTMSLMPCERL